LLTSPKLSVGTAPRWSGCPIFASWRDQSQVGLCLGKRLLLGLLLS
jgi:hypothetical protein